MKLFNLWDMQEVKVEDPGLQSYINLDIKLVPKSRGKEVERFGKARVNIVERIISLIGVPGHRGKKHKIITRSTGKYYKNTLAVLEALKIIEAKSKQNPIQVLVKAIENAAFCDETTTIEYGGARYLQAVDSAPIRRLNITLRNIVHGAQDKSFRKKASIAEALADEILAAFNKDPKSLAMSKRNEAERQADAAR